MMRGLGTSQLKRVVSKMPHRQGETVYKCEVVSTSLWKNPGKMQAENPRHQPSTQRNPESRLTCQTPGSRGELVHEAATHFPAPGAPPQPEPQFPRWKQGSGEGWWEFQHSNAATPLRPWMIQPLTLGCPGFWGGNCQRGKLSEL